MESIDLKPAQDSDPKVEAEQRNSARRDSVFLAAIRQLQDAR